MTHSEASPLAGKTVTVKMVHPQLSGDTHEFEVEDWWDRLVGRSWTVSDGNPAAMVYAMRIGGITGKIPWDDEVVYGKIDGMGHLVHVKEIEA